MSFLHSWAIAIGVLGLGLPVLIHWLTRPRPVRRPLSTVRFVRQVIHDRRSRNRLRDMLILVFRTLAVLLLALTASRPLWGKRPLVSDGETGETVRVVLIDVSQSMGATVGAVEAIERARTIAADYLRYRPGLQANLVRAGARAREVFEQPSANFEILRRELSACRAQPERCDVQRALDVVSRMLTPASADDTRRRELVVVSDFQRANWAMADFSRLPKDVKIQLESVAAKETPANVAILRAEARASHARNRTVQLEVEIGNATSTARKVSVNVTLGATVRQLTGLCPGGRRTRLSEEVELSERGWLWGEARLVGIDDALAADNVRPIVVEVRARPQYVVLTRDALGRRPTSSFFLQSALAVHESRDDAASASVVRVDPADLQVQSLGAADMVFLDHPGKLSDTVIRLLADQLHRGRPMLYVAGEPIDATNLKRLREVAQDLQGMPVEFLPPAAGHSRPNLFLTSFRRDVPAFRGFGVQLDSMV